MRHNEQERVKASIVEAAAMLIQEGQASILSLELVADAAGMEQVHIKDYFPTLEDLFEAIVTEMVSSFRDRIQDELGTDDTPGAWHRAYIRASIPMRDDRLPDIAGALLASAPFRDRYLTTFRDVLVDFAYASENDGVSVEVSTLIRLTFDGIWLNRMFGLTAISREMEDAAIEALKKMV